MKKHILVYFVVTFAALSCKLLPSTTGNTGENDPTRSYMLRLNPPPEPNSTIRSIAKPTIRALTSGNQTKPSAPALTIPPVLK